MTTCNTEQGEEPNLILGHTKTLQGTEIPSWPVKSDAVHENVIFSIFDFFLFIKKF